MIHKIHRKTPALESFLIKLQALRTATFLERDSCETCEIFKNTLFYWKSPVAASDSFRFPALKAVAQTYSLKKVFLEISQNSQEYTYVRVSILIKLQARSSTLLK